jgi:hypothetical protein
MNFTDFIALLSLVLVLTGHSKCMRKWQLLGFSTWVSGAVLLSLFEGFIIFKWLKLGGVMIICTMFLIMGLWILKNKRLPDF